LNDPTTTTSGIRSSLGRRHANTTRRARDFGGTVDDVEPVYRAAERWNAFDDDAFRNRLVELPGDVVQLYVRDPAGNLVEIDHHGVDRLPDDLRAQLKGLWDFNAQDDEQMSARLFVPD